jgi:hypothetical protein
MEGEGHPGVGFFLISCPGKTLMSLPFEERKGGWEKEQGRYSLVGEGQAEDFFRV